MIFTQYELSNPRNYFLCQNAENKRYNIIDVFITVWTLTAHFVEIYILNVLTALLVKYQEMQFNNNAKKKVKQYNKSTNLYFNDSLYVENDSLRQTIFLLLQNPTYQFNKNSYFNVSQYEHEKIKRSSECTTKNGNLG